MLHGDDALKQAERASGIFFGEEITDVSVETLLEIFADVPSTEVPKERVLGGDFPVLDLIVSTGIVSSKGEGRRAIEGGGLYLNNARVSSPADKIPRRACLHGKFIVLRKGGRNYTLVKLV